jgi:hypothetical protein
MMGVLVMDIMMVAETTKLIGINMVQQCILVYLSVAL